jgi:hypothetical protein
VRRNNDPCRGVTLDLERAILTFRFGFDFLLDIFSQFRIRGLTLAGWHTLFPSLLSVEV